MDVREVDGRVWCREQGFEVGERGPMPPDAKAAWEAAVEMGLVAPLPPPPSTDADIVRAERCGVWMEGRERFCRMGRVTGTDVCVVHGGAAIIEARAVGHLRQYIADTILPIAVERLKGILLDPDERTTDIIRASVAIMDRSGLGPVQGVVVSGEVTMAAPLDVLQQMLTNGGAMPLPRVEDVTIIEGDVVSDTGG